MSVPAETNGDEVTSWIPLTSVLTPSSGCESIFRLNGPSLVAFDPGYGLDIDASVRCLPSAVTTWWEQARLGVGIDDHTVLSIQPLTCPHLWTTVATFRKNKSSTQIMCCPSGYSNQHATSGPVNGDCVSDISKGMVLTYASTAATATTDWSTITTTMTASSTIGAIAIVGFNVARTSSTSTSSTSTSSPSASSTASSSTPPSTTTTVTVTTSPSSNDGLSTGVQAGIGVGVSLGVLGIVALILAIILLRRRSQKHSDGSSVVALGPVYDSGAKPMDATHHGFQHHSGPSYELHGGHQPQELPSGEIRSPVEIGSPNP